MIPIDSTKELIKYDFGKEKIKSLLKNDLSFAQGSILSATTLLAYFDHFKDGTVHDSVSLFIGSLLSVSIFYRSWARSRELDKLANELDPLLDVLSRASIFRLPVEKLPVLTPVPDKINFPKQAVTPLLPVAKWFPTARFATSLRV